MLKQNNKSENEIEEEIRKAVEKNLDDTKLELPILFIEDLPIKLLSKDFVDWYFKDDLSCEIIKEYKKLGSLSKQEDVLKILKEYKYNKNGSFDIKKKGSYKRISFALFLKELRLRLEQK